MPADANENVRPAHPLEHECHPARRPRAARTHRARIRAVATAFFGGSDFSGRATRSISSSRSSFMLLHLCQSRAQCVARSFDSHAQAPTGELQSAPQCLRTIDLRRAATRTLPAAPPEVIPAPSALLRPSRRRIPLPAPRPRSELRRTRSALCDDAARESSVRHRFARIRNSHGSNRASSLKSRETVVHPHERVLHRFFCILVVLQHVARETQAPRIIKLHDLDEGLLFTTFRPEGHRTINFVHALTIGLRCLPQIIPLRSRTPPPTCPATREPGFIYKYSGKGPPRHQIGVLFCPM